MKLPASNPWRRILEYAVLLATGIGLGFGVSWLRQVSGWPSEAVEWGLLGLMVLVLAYAGYAAYRYYRALLEDDEDF